MQRQIQSSYQCPVCEGVDIQLILEIEQVPAHCNLLWSEKDLALEASRGDIQLGYCSTCTHIYNYAFDASQMEYTQAYENSLHFSPHFHGYASSLASQLIDKYDLHDRTIIEIGAGKGDFLIMLCELGDNRGLGFDPSYDPALSDQQTGRVTFINDYYSDKHAGIEADLICCRHVLEHIEDPSSFLANIRRAIADTRHSVVFFEVPNVMYTLADLGIWDIIYEHCSYFNRGSIAWLFSSVGFQVLNISETFSGQFLTLDALPAKSAGSFHMESKGIRRHVAKFTSNYHQKVGAWQEELDRISETGQKAVVWGAGSKGVSFLNTLDSMDIIEYVVDLNPRKHGMFIAGTGQQIVPPEFLKEYQPDCVVIMNPNYEKEIHQILDDMKLDTVCLIA